MPKTKEHEEVIACSPKHLGNDQLHDAATVAEQENPFNRPSHEKLAQVLPAGAPMTEFIAVMTTKYWRTNGVRLGVGFMDNPPNELRARLLSHMNAWGQSANVQFAESTSDPAVRISRDQPGYWSYIGTDVLLIDKNQPTMNLQGFTMNTPDSEFYRVVRHETGHTLGCPHEHMRAEIIALIDEQKAIQFFGATQGWTEAQVRAQVLTPLPASSIWATTSPDRQSIMCYQIPGSITKNGVAIPGGLDIDQIDYDFMAKVYPKPASVIGSTPASSDLTAPPAASTAMHHHDGGCKGCIDVALKSGTRLSVPPEATEAQVRMLLGALR